MKTNEYSESFAVTKTKELVEATKEAIDILIGTLKEEFDFEDTADASKLKSFTESKLIAFKHSKELIKEVETLEKQLEQGEGVELEDKEFNSNLLEQSATIVK